MKKKFILPFLTLMVICGFVIHGYIMMSSVFTFILEVAFSVLATYVVIHTAVEQYNNSESDTERYNFLSIILTVFFDLVVVAAIALTCVMLYAMEDITVLQICDDIIVIGVASQFVADVAVWHIYHCDTVLPRNHPQRHQYEFDF